MKRILAILCVIACLCGLCVPAMAAAVDLGGLSSLALVGTGVPGAADWTPGDAAGDFVKASEGVYVKVISVTAGHAMSFKIAGNDAWDDAYNFGGMEDGVVVALGTKIDLANGGGSKDISLTAAKDGNLKFTVDLNGEVPTLVVEETTDDVTGPGTPSTPSTPSTPAKPNSLAMAGTGIPGVGEWNPGDPAGDMVMVSDGVYTKIITATAGSTMQFKIAGNDAWDDNFNFGGAEDGTTATLGTKVTLINGAGSKDITFTATADGNLKVTVDLNAMTLLIEATTEEPGDVTPPAVGDGETYTVYAKVPDDWKSPSIWCWNDAAQNPPTLGSWPGSLVMTKGEDGWYSVEVPVGYNNLLINANAGGVQTPDIVGCGGSDVWINAYTDPTTPVFSYEAISDDEIGKPTTAPPIEITVRPTRGTDPVEGTQATQNADQNKVTAETKENDITVLLIAIGSAVVLVAVVVVFIVMKKKQSKA